MKRLLISFLFALALVVFPASVHADPAKWAITLSTPPASIGGTTLELSYGVLSAVASETFEIKLYEEAGVTDTLLGTQSITHANGDSGVFELTVSPGEHEYYIVVLNSNGETKTSETVNTTVEEPTATGAVARTAAADDGTTTDTAGSDEASDSTADSDADVEGSTDNTDADGVGDDEDSSNTATYVVGGFALAILIFTLYWVRVRSSLEQ